MRDLRPALTAGLRGDGAAWREFVRATLPHVDASVRRMLDRAPLQHPPSVDDVCVAAYDALRRDQGRFLLRVEADAEGRIWTAVLARRAVVETVGNAEAAVDTQEVSRDAVATRRAYRESTLDPQERAGVALFYFRGLRYAQIADVLGLSPPDAAGHVRSGAEKVLARLMPPSLPPAPPRSSSKAPGATTAAAGTASCPPSASLFDLVHREAGEDVRRSLAEHTERCDACRGQADRYRWLLVELAAAAVGRGQGSCLSDDELLTLARRRTPESRSRSGPPGSHAAPAHGASAADRGDAGRGEGHALEALRHAGVHLAECPICWEAYEILRARTPEPHLPSATLETPLARRVLALNSAAARSASDVGTRVRTRAERFRTRRQRLARHAVRRRVVVGAVAAVGLVGLVLAGLWLPRGKASSPAPADDAAAPAPKRPPARSGKGGRPLEGERPPAASSARAGAALSGISGRLFVRTGGLGATEPVRREATVAHGDELVAYDDGATFVLGGASIGLREATLRVSPPREGELRLELDEGEAHVRVTEGGPSVVLQGPHGRVESARPQLGPIAYLVQAWRERTALVVYQGQARLLGHEGRVEVIEGAWSSVRAGEGPIGIVHRGSPPPPAWLQHLTDAGGATHPYFDLIVPVRERPSPTIVAVPHATREPGAGRVAARLGRALDAPVVFARHFEPLDVHRPTVTRWGPTPILEATPQAQQAHDEYRIALLHASGGRDFPIRLYIELHGDELTGAGPMPAVEVVTRGTAEGDLDRMKSAWLRAVARVPAEARLPILVDILDPVFRMGNQEVPFAFSGYPGSFGLERGTANAQRALIVRLPRLARADMDVARRYGEALGEAIADMLSGK